MSLATRRLEDEGAAYARAHTRLRAHLRTPPLTLRRADLEGAGIEHPLHRRSILFAVEALAIAKGARGGGGGNGGGSDETGAGGAAATGQGPSSPPPAAAALSRLASGSHEPAYDVFIS